MTKILINAGPGSGKTTTLVNTHRYLLTGLMPSRSPSDEQYHIMETIRREFPSIQPQEAVFACMTNAGKEDIEKRISKPTRAFTYNGLGASILIRNRRRPVLNNRRGQQLLEAVLGQKLSDIAWNQRKEYYAALKYLEHLKQELLPVTEENIYFIQEKYGMQTSPPENLGVMQATLEKMALFDGYAEWIDQIWLAVQSIKAPMYKIGYVDECQDLSSLKLLFMIKACANLVFCGDPYQSINAFAGADYTCFNKIKTLSVQELPLKTCFRCPINHIEHANTIRPARLKAHKTIRVPDKVVPSDGLGDYIRENVDSQHSQLMIARLNNILIRVGIRLLKQGIACHIMSRSNENSISEVLLKYIEKSKAQSLKQLCLIATSDAENAAKLSFQAGTTVKEKCACILELADGLSTIPQVKERLHNLTKSSAKSIPLATIHKAKGLEADYIYILFPPVQMSPENKDQREQEINLEFVAETRSKYQKVYVRE
jgi:hypothetical protein